MTMNKIICSNLSLLRQTMGKMSAGMSAAYEAAKDKFNDIIRVITEKDCLNLPKEKLKTEKKKKVFIFNEFDESNEAFKYIYTANTVHILGTRCLLSVLLEGISTTAGAYHICNLSMKNLVVCATNLTRDEKKELKQLVLFMGGWYLDDLKDTVTHLISNSVSSLKYEVAAQKGLKIMHTDWVRNVWTKTQCKDIAIRADDPQFDTFKLPIFFNLVLTCTGLKFPERNVVKTIVEENGGRYSSSFKSDVDILITEKECVGNQKFNAAAKLKKMILSSAWIHDSLEKGYAMPIDEYRLGEVKAAASTPTKSSGVNQISSKFNPDNTQLSDISRATFYKAEISLNETAATSTSSRQSIVPEIPQGFKQTLIDAKKVGNVLDGCNILLTGFSAADLPLISKIISVLGATKMDSINEQVTHVIVGTVDRQLFSDLDEHHVEAAVLKVDWLKSIVNNKTLVDEENFMIPRPASSKEKACAEKPSPASKKAMKSLSGVFKKPEVPKLQLDQPEDEELNIVNQYLDPSTSSNSLEVPEDFSFQSIKFLTGKKLFVCGYKDAVMGADVVNAIDKYGGNLVDNLYAHQVDYVITPPGLMGEVAPPMKYKHIVSDIWINDSADAGMCIEPLYYHHPIPELLAHEKPLMGEVFVVSNYKGPGRSFIEILVKNLGGKYMEIMKRADIGILISPNTEGKKFESAQMWDWTVLTVDWLIACLESKQRVDERPFLIGNTKPSARNLKDSRRSIVPSSQDIEIDSPIFAAGKSDSPFTPVRQVSRDSYTAVRTPVFNVERLVEGMPTPQRQDTLAVLLENQKKESPRKKRLQAIINTPATRSKLTSENCESPRPTLPECMKPLTKDYGIRPNSTPNSQAFHKRKLEGLDLNYIALPPDKKRSVETEEQTPPFAHRRYDFYKTRLSDYNSPDPRASSALPKPPVTQCLFNERDSAKALAFNEDDVFEAPARNDGTFRDLQKFEELRAKAVVKRKSFAKAYLVEESEDVYEERPKESEHMVEWAEVTKETVEPEEEVDKAVIVQNDQLKFVFTLTGVSDSVKEEITDKIIELGGTVSNDSSSYTHLIAEKPNQGEKYLMAIARGRPVLHADFIRESCQIGAFGDFEIFEFGNPRFLPSLLKKCKFDSEDVLFKAPYTWRQWITDEHKDRFSDGAFTGKSFMIAAGNKAAPFISVLEAGGGKHIKIDSKEPLKSSLIKRQKIDYCFYDDKFLKSENVEILKKCNVTMAKLGFIKEFLMRQTVPN